VVTVNGTPVNLPLPGTNDNDWGTPQTMTIPVSLNGGDNTLQFGNSADYAPDIDKISI
jgi:hypothetical protein